MRPSKPCMNRFGRSHAQWPAVVTCVWVGLLTTAPGCNEDLLPPVTPVAAQPDTVDAGVADVPDAGKKAPKPTLNVAVKPFDPNRKRDEAQKKVTVAKLVAGEDIVDVALRPEVVTTSALLAEEVSLSTSGMEMPAAGNEELLDLKAGAVLVGGVPDGDKRRARGGNNAFGFMRKVKSVKQVGDKIVVETENAALTDVFDGSLQVTIAWGG